MSKGSRLLIIVRICFAIKLFCQIVRTLRRMTYKKRLKKLKNGKFFGENGKTEENNIKVFPEIFLVIDLCFLIFT